MNTPAPDLQLPAGLPGLNLLPTERVIANLRPDLDESLRFSPGLVVLSNLRLLVPDGSASFRSFELSSGLTLRKREHAGLTELCFFERGERVLRVHYTLALAPAGHEFETAFEAARGAPNARASQPEPELDDEFALPDVAPIVGRPLWRLFAFARPRFGKVAIGLALTLGTTAVGLIPPYLTMPLVDKVLVPWQEAHGLSTQAAYHSLYTYLVGLAAAAFVAWLLAWAQGAVLAWVSELISADLRNRSFSHLQRLSLQYFGGKRTGDLINRISSETDRLCSFLSDTLIDFITDVLMIVGTAIVLFWLDPLLALAALASFPPIAWFMVRVRSALTHGFLRGSRAWAQMTNILSDTIPGIRVVKAFSAERREIARFERANAKIVTINNRVNTLWTSFWPLVALLNQLGLLVVWGVGAWEILHHRITVGVLTAFIAYISRFYTRVESMSRVLTVTQRAAAAAQRLFDILDRVPSVIEAKDPLPLGHVEGEIRFEHVSFRYGSRLVLDDVSFTVKPGQMVGIVGHTGSGKSTVSNLICRFYDASSGAVRIDGTDIRRVALEEYRGHIGIVLQDPFLFFGTIGDNVAYGAPDSGAARIIQAARAARAHDFILKLPEAYDSLVGERGQSLSGGERQRIAIARAILVDPRILILDEATSAVDVQTEREIQVALDNVVQGRTTVAIAHRLSTLRKADLLVVLKDGKIAEIGSASELLAKDGEYAKLVRAQSATQSETANATSEAAEAGDATDASHEARPLLDAAGLALELDPDGQLWATVRSSGERLSVAARRAFPLTNPDRYVSLVDGQGQERVCFEDLSLLAASKRAVLDRALNQADFLPVIARILSVTQEATSSLWRVDTDRGTTEFIVDQEDHVRPLEDGRHLISDAHGMRYLVPVPSALDAPSRKILARFS
jgi:ATP-binding cassette, subfamily B, bacterial